MPIMPCVHTTTFRGMSKSRHNDCGFGVPEFSRSLAIKLPLFNESDYHWKSSEFNPPNNTDLYIHIFWLMQKICCYREGVKKDSGLHRAEVKLCWHFVKISRVAKSF